MACFGEFMPHRIAGGGRKGKVHKDNIRVQFCMLYFAWEQHLFLLSFSSKAESRGVTDLMNCHGFAYMNCHQIDWFSVISQPHRAAA